MDQTVSNSTEELQNLSHSERQLRIENGEYGSSNVFQPVALISGPDRTRENSTQQNITASSNMQMTEQLIR